MFVIDSDESQVEYIDNFLSPDGITLLKDKLLDPSIEYSRSVYKIFGKEVPAPRVTTSFGDEGLTYQDYSGPRQTTGWPYYIVGIKERLESLSGQNFNFVLINKYNDGNDYIGYHADKEKGLVRDSIIASISLGAERDFCLKDNKSKDVHKILLKEGSLLLMRGETQKHYKHSLPKRKGISTPRINLTFRLTHGI